MADPINPVSHVLVDDDCDDLALYALKRFRRHSTDDSFGRMPDEHRLWRIENALRFLVREHIRSKFSTDRKTVLLTTEKIFNGEYQ
jgi:hypothetical protein